MDNFLNIPKRNNIQVWKNTKQMFSKQGPFYNVPVYKSIAFHDLDNLKNQLTGQKPQEPIIEVVNDDSITYAKTFLDSGLNPLVLNMANHKHPGGGVAYGSRAQEEDLFRRSNYHLTLNKNILPKDTYPLANVSVIYSPNVYIIKDKNYQVINNPFNLSFIACPAIQNPEIAYDMDKVPCYKNIQDHELMYRKIEMIYLTAIYTKHDSLVLGAFGCGAFNNPTSYVARIFADMNKKYGKYFKKIGFAVLSVDGDDKFNIFKDILSN